MTRKDRIYPFFFAALCLYAFAPQYFSDKVICWLDMAHYFLPFRELTAEAVRQGIIPMWNPYLYCGNPLMANMQSAVFYPLSAFFYLLPPDAAIRGITFAAFFIMSFSFYHLARLYKISEEGSLAAAAVFAFNFFMMVKAPELADLHVMVWMPAALYFMKKHISDGALHDAVLCGLAVSLSFLGGHPQVFLYALLVYAAFFFYESAENKKTPLNMGRSFLIISAVPIFTVSLQAVSVYKFLMLSKRADSGLTVEEIKGSYLGIKHIALFFFPFLAQQFEPAVRHLSWSGLVSAGPALLPLALAGLIYGRKGGLKLLLGAGFAVSLFLSLLGIMPFFEQIAEALPFIKTMRYPSKINVILLLCLALIIGLGFDAVFGGDNRRSGTAKSSVLLFAFFAAVFAVLKISGNSIISFYRKNFAPDMNFQEVYDAVTSFGIVMSGFGEWLFILALAAAAVYFAGKSLRADFFLKAGVILLIVLTESHYSNRQYSYYDNVSIMNSSIKSAEFIKNSGNNPRVLAPNAMNRLEDKEGIKDMASSLGEAREMLLPNAAMSAKLRNADGFDSLMLASHFRLKKNFNMLSAPWESPAFALFSASYIASAVPIEGRSLSLAHKGAGYIYKNSNSAANAFFVPMSGRVSFSSSADEVQKIIMKEGFDAYTDLVIESAANGGELFSAVSQRGYAVEYIPEDLNTIKVKAKNDVPGFLVVTDNNYPGWSAYVNEKKQQVYSAYAVYKAVKLEPGTHEVVFKYREEGAYRLLAAAIVFLAALAAAAFFYRRGAWKK